MKLISVQSRGNRLVRVILTKKQLFIVYGKTTAYHREWGTTHTATTLAGTGRNWQKKEALKAAKQWLEGAAV